MHIGRGYLGESPTLTFKLIFIYAENSLHYYSVQIFASTISILYSVENFVIASLNQLSHKSIHIANSFKQFLLVKTDKNIII